MTLGALSLAAVVAVGAAVGLVLRGPVPAALPSSAPSSAPARASASASASASADPDIVAVTEEEITALVEGHGRALASGDADAFVSIFDGKLADGQRRVFANLRKVPLAEVSYQVLQRSGQSADSFGRGLKFTQDVAFVHRFAGADLRPVSEWYRWTVEKASAGAPLVVTKVAGAPPPSLGGTTKTVYYPGPWDIWPDIEIVRAGAGVVLARPQHADLARRVAPIVARATTANLAFWRRNGDPRTVMPTGFVVALAEGPTQLGNLFRKTTASEAGVSIAMPSWGSGDVKIGGTRVVLDTTSGYFDTQAGLEELVTHELAHSLVASLDAGGFSLFGKANWIVEGFAEYLTNRDIPVSRTQRYHEGRAYLAGQRAQPFTGTLPSNLDWGRQDLTHAHYLMGELAMRHIAARYGDRKLTAAVTAAYRAGGDDAEAALFRTLGVTRTDFERQWANYVRKQLA